MIRRTFNLIASAAAFALGSVYLFSDGASVTADVIGASGSVAGFASLMGIVMIIGSIGLFIIALHSTDDQAVDLERLLRRTRDHRELSGEHISQESIPNAPHHKKK